MIRRKLKSMCGLTLALVLVANMSPVISYAITDDGNNSDNTISREREFDSSYLRKDDAEIKESKIIEGIDTKSEESISVIVEFVSPSIAEGASDSAKSRNFIESKIDRDHRIFNEFLADMPVKYSSKGNSDIKYSYKEVFNGVSLIISGSEIENLVNCPVVKRIYPDTTVKVDFPEKLEVNSEGITNLPEGKMGDSVPHIGVEDLHEESITGKGVKVGVLDTGIDYNHPDLTSAYKGFRAEDGDPSNQDINSIKGWDFISNDADPMETTYEDWLESNEPEMDIFQNYYYTSHGTHVSGTIAGRAENQENNMAVKGVAPEVELYGYRVLGQYGSGATSGIIAAVEKSVKDGMDVINMSLGSSNGTPFDPLVTAVNNATLAGVVTVISNGNAGPNQFTVGSPGTAQLPIAVGASTTPTKFESMEVECKDGVKLSTANHIVKDFDETLDGNYGVSYEAVYCGLGDESDFEGKDLTGKVALVDRGEITFVEKAKNAKNAGAEFTIIMNNTTDSEIPNQGEHKAGNAIAVNMSDGAALKETLNENGTTNITLNKLADDILKGDELTGFSSAGPVRLSEEIRPDIVAPGYQTFSTVPEYMNDKNLDVDDYSGAYGRMSGTSMSAPHITGVAALILQENPDYTPADVKAVMMNTSEDLNQFRNDEYSVHQQGAGRVNAYEAVHEETHVTANYKTFDGTDNRELDNESGLISFGKFTKEEVDPENKSKSIPLTIENNSNLDKTYSISVKYSNSDRANEAEANGVSIELENTVTVQANSEITLDATLNILGDANPGIYEGYIIIVDEESGKDYQVPFSASYKNSGFDVLTYPEMQGGFGKGMTAITSSDLFNRDVSQQGLFADIEVLVQVNEPVSKIYSFVKDINTGEYIGYSGGDMDASWIPSGQAALVSALVQNGRVQKLKGNNITNEYFMLDDGVYELELIAIRPDGTTFKGKLPMAIVNDNYENEMTVNFDSGVTEVTEDMYTTETWADGNDYEAIWMEGNIGHPIVDKLKSDYGMDYLEQSEVNYPAFSYITYNGMITNLPAWAKENGDFLLAGIERSDLENGPFVLEGKSINPGKVGSKSESYILINEGESYLELEMDNNTVKVGEKVNSKLTLNNVEDLVKGSFELSNYGNAIFNISDIKPTEELASYLESNGNSIEISFEEIESDFDIQTKYLVSFEILGDNVAGITGDIPFLDVSYELSDMRGIVENKYNSGTFVENTFTAEDGNFKNSNNDSLSISVETVKGFLEFVEEDKTRVFGTISTEGFEVEDIEIYALDSDGVRYETDYQTPNRYSRDYVFNNLPAIDGEYKIYANIPGHFGVVGVIPGGEYVNGELVGTQVDLSKDSLLSQNLEGIAGDANEDGAIDMHDVNMVIDSLDKEVINTQGNAPDFNQDGVVDLEDFMKLYENYGKQDFNREDSKEPELVVDGRDIIDVLEELGIFENGQGFGINLDKDINESFEGEKVTLTANPEYDPGYYKFRFYTRKSGEINWNLSREESGDNVFEWIPESAGDYEVKVRAVHPSGQEIQDTVTHKVESLDSIVVSPVNDFEATTINKKNVIVEWNTPENTKGLTGYILYKDGKKVAEVGAEETSYNFKGLKRHTIYNFKVAAKYANGEVSTKESITLRTKR